jgi:Winged helix-turn-helix DNA-binding
MPTHKQRILEYLAQHPQGADDDQLAELLAISPRQTVNRMCRELEDDGLVVRMAGSSGKIVNQSARSAHASSPSPQPASPASLITVIGPLITLRTDEAARQFAYDGEIDLKEKQVSRAVKAALEADDWQVTVKEGHAHGIDLDAHRGAARLILEARGEGWRSQMRDNYFVGALGQLLQRMDTDEVSYGLALPAHRKFVRLALSLPQLVRMRLALRFYLVRPAEDGLTVAVIPPPYAGGDGV